MVSLLTSEPLWEQRLLTYGFKTKNSNDITPELLHCAERNVDRFQAIMKISQLAGVIKAKDIEAGIFEYALVVVQVNSYELELVTNIYDDKVHEVLHDLKDPTVLDDINPYYLGFLDPWQVNPRNWSALIEKKNMMEDMENNLDVTTLYKCKRCGSNRSRSMEIQLRCADEPAQIMTTCLGCYATVIH